MTRHKQLLLLTISTIILLSPNILLVFIGGDTIVASNLKKVVFIIYSASIILFFLSFIKPKIFAFLSLFLTPLIIFEIFSITLLKGPSSEEIIASTISTNYNEAKELLESYVVYIFLFLIILIVQLYIFYKIKSSYKLDIKQRKFFLFFSLFIISTIYARDNYIAFKTLKNNATFENVIHISTYHSLVKFNKIFPIDFFLKLNSVHKGRKKLKKYSEKIIDFKFGAHQENEGSQIYILVIGETARRNNFEIYGYKRNTTPKLASKKNILAFNNIKSAANVTSISLPFIITRTTPNNKDVKFEEPPITKAFKEASFKTYWISNQSYSQGSIFNLFAQQSDKYINTAVSLDVPTLDNQLIQKLENILKDKSTNRKFIIIHLIGSHFRYNLRYPKEFEIFKPVIEKGLSLESNNNLNKNKFINSYDNSILYTDYILGEFINRLKAKNQISYLYYISDHGENLFDDENDLFLHGLNTPSQYELNVPLIIWYSDKYERKYPNKIDVLKNNISKRLSSTNTFHTLLDLSDIRYTTENLSKSFANSNFDSLQNQYFLKTDNTIIKLK